MDEAEEEIYKIPAEWRHQAKKDFKNDLEIMVAPLELIEQLDVADKALNGDSNDDEHDALVKIREWLHEVLKSGRRE